MADADEPTAANERTMTPPDPHTRVDAPAPLTTVDAATADEFDIADYLSTVAAPQPEPDPAPAATSSAESVVARKAGTVALIAELNRLGHWPSFHEAAGLGAELVEHPSTQLTHELHLANGDVVYPTDTGWNPLDDVRQGARVRSGNMERIHRASVDGTARVNPTARIDPSARIEPGAVIGAHATIGPDVHVGRDAEVGRYSTLKGGAFIGAGAQVRHGCEIGPGVVVGAASEVGEHSMIGSGATIDQRARLPRHSTIATGTNASTPADGKTPARKALGQHVSHAAHLLERLTSLNRE